MTFSYAVCIGFGLMYAYEHCLGFMLVGERLKDI